MLFYNEDWIHFIGTRYMAGIEITEEVLRDYIYSFKDSQVTDFAMNINGTVSTADSKILETFAQKYMAENENGIKVDYKNTFARNAYELIEVKKIDMYSVFIDALREIGINPWISVRMNDCHGNMERGDIRKSSYVDANPEYHIASFRERVGYFDQCYDYGHEEIRSMMKNYIDEMLGRYDVFGLELDMMREAFFFKYGYESCGFAIMNEFMADVCSIICKYEKKYGHPIKLSLILPSNPNILIERGIDICGFIDKIDFITIIPRWETIDTDMPIELWKQLLRGSDIKLGCGQQLLFKPYRDYKATTSSVKMAFGQAIANLSRGSDYVYLYNYMDMGEFEGTIGDWIYEDSIRNDKNRPYMFGNIGERETLLLQERSHVVTYNDYLIYNIGTYCRLPILFGEGSGYEYIKIPVGELPEKCEIRLILGIKQEDDIFPEDICAYVNSEKCEFLRKTHIEEKIYENDCYVFSVKPADLKIMIAEIKINKRCALEYVEINVVPFN